jgi:hypothetical protein
MSKLTINVPNDDGHWTWDAATATLTYAITDSTPNPNPVPPLGNCRWVSVPPTAIAGVAFPVSVDCDNGPPINAAQFYWHQYGAGFTDRSKRTRTPSTMLTLPAAGVWALWVEALADNGNGSGTAGLVQVQVSEPVTQDVTSEFDKIVRVPLKWENGVGNIHAYTRDFGHMGPNDAVVVEITAPAQIGTNSGGWIAYTDTPPNPSIQRLAVLSDQPCDFTKGLAKATGDGDSRAFTGGTSGTIYFSTIHGNSSGLPVMSVPGRTYYLNIKNAADAGTGNCDLDIEFSVPK